MPDRYIMKLDLVWLFHSDDYRYCVVKKPVSRMGTNEPPKVREGCTVFSDGRWFYWCRETAVDYEAWKSKNRWCDHLANDPDEVVRARLNGGRLTTNGGEDGLVLPPEFKERGDNNWVKKSELVVPSVVTYEMLGHLRLAHLQLSEEVRTGRKLQHAKK